MSGDKNHYPGAISQLPGLLSWTERGESYAALARNHEKRLFIAWGNALVQIYRLNTDLGRSLTIKARALPQDSFRRFLTAPAVVHTILGEVSGDFTQETISFLADALDAEDQRLTGRAGPGRALWTALGDWHICDQTVGDPDALSATTAKVFQAPLVAGHIPLDYKSPFVRNEEMTRFYGPYAAFTDVEVQRALSGLDAAAEGISQSSSRAIEFIKLFTRVIVARKNSDRPDRAGSRSFSRYIGATIIENPHDSTTDAAALADSLVHEAIHHMLYSEELQRPFASDAGLAKSFHVLSPWSGRRLNFRQYLHACVVWFGLWAFWSLCADSAAFPEEEVRSHIRRAAHGFSQGPLLDCLSPVLEYASPELQSAISEMQQVVSREALRLSAC
ncbi:MAG TPA: HEXXH motif-containing putative peptide modification protein [Blastocatellia bacterium]|nr:HEXXH motif-containing putative peptide modification protein [Blastocatellia bacterium]